jgi:hypothetical protein
LRLAAEEKGAFVTKWQSCSGRDDAISPTTAIKIRVFARITRINALFTIAVLQLIAEGFRWKIGVKTE